MKRVILLIGSNRGYELLKSVNDYFKDKEDFELFIFTFLATSHEPNFTIDIENYCRENSIDYSIDNKVDSEKYKSIWSECEISIVCGWRFIVPRSTFKLPKKGAFVTHDSLLPELRGFSPTVWGIRLGKSYGGVTFFKMDDSIDEGEIVDQKRIDFKGRYIKDIMMDITDATIEIVMNNLPKIIDNSVNLKPQDHSKATYCWKLVPSDFKINWKMTSNEILNMIKSYSEPYPGCFSFCNEEIFYIDKASIEEDSLEYSGYIPGSIKSINPDNSVSIFCGEGILKIEEIRTKNNAIKEPSILLNSINLRL